jgi:hypothetical protein
MVPLLPIIFRREILLDSGVVVWRAPSRLKSPGSQQISTISAVPQLPITKIRLKSLLHDNSDVCGEFGRSRPNHQRSSVDDSCVVGRSGSGLLTSLQPRVRVRACADVVVLSFHRHR